MTRALLVAVLYLSSAFMASVSAANIPFTLDLSKRTDRDQLREDRINCNAQDHCTKSSHRCWYVALTYKYPLSQPTISSDNRSLMLHPSAAPLDKDRGICLPKWLWYVMSLSLWLSLLSIIIIFLQSILTSDDQWLMLFLNLAWRV
jgi:hypothetical protein